MSKKNRLFEAPFHAVCYSSIPRRPIGYHHFFLPSSQAVVMASVAHRLTAASFLSFGLNQKFHVPADTIAKYSIRIRKDLGMAYR